MVWGMSFVHAEERLLQLFVWFFFFPLRENCETIGLLMAEKSGHKYLCLYVTVSTSPVSYSTSAQTSLRVRALAPFSFHP